MKKILFVNQYVTHLFVDVINDFVANGVEVSLLTGSIQSARPLSEKVKVKYLAGYRRRNVFLRLLTWHVFGMQAFFYMLFRRYPVFVTTNPPFLPMITFFVSRLTGIRYYLLIYDLYPEVLVKMGFLKPDGWVVKCWNYMNVKSLRKASRVFTISETMKRSLLSVLPESREIHVIPPWMDKDRIRPLPKTENPFVRENRLEKKIVVLYSGNMGLTHDMESILQAALKLQDDPGIIFVLIGDGAKKKMAENFVSDHRLTNVILLPWQPEDRVLYTFASADVGIVALGKSAEGISLPSKTFSYLAAGTALLAISEPGSELERLVMENGVGAVFSPGDITGITGFIVNLARNTVLLKDFQKKSRSLSELFGIQNSSRFYGIMNGPLKKIPPL